MKKTVVAAALCVLVIPFAALAQSPSGFNAAPSAQPQGFALTTLKSIEEVKQNSYDEQLVVLRGRFTRQVSHDKYEFTDEKGNTIVAELDDDKDWSHVAKDALMDILAEVDRDHWKVELEVLEAKPAR
ncbi:MAG TPA: NirD/YgiW/YdeI family stress tolerance protein [Sutterellaceae bacterium]|nr:NirD/YgiW/YdeI family stress tolerance protein [Sutterellaceae bacterium]